MVFKKCRIPCSDFLNTGVPNYENGLCDNCGFPKSMHKIEPTRTELLAEIDRLKSELELRDKVIEQATMQMVANDEGDIFIRSISKEIFVGCTEDCPELYAHLAGRWWSDKL